MEEVNIVAGAAVTSQPAAGNNTVFAMPPPTGTATNPTNPFTGGVATEATSLNTAGSTTYTPGMLK